MTELLNPIQQKSMQQRLMEAYSKKREQNSAYSLRAFSKRIGVSSGALSEILQNKRRMTMATARKVLHNLHFNESEIEEILTAKKTRNKKERSYQDLSLDQYQVLSNWHYLALLNLFELQDVEHDVKSLARRLNLAEKKIEEAILRLLKLEMIEEKKGRYVRTFIRYQTTEDIANSAIKKYHHETFELAEYALRNVEPELRDFSSMVLKLNPKNLKKLKSLVREFEDEVSDLVENDDPQEIYHMNIHLYPVTHNRGSDV